MSANRLSCKRCGTSDHAKSGLARGRRRYRCRSCGAHFTDTPLRGKPPATKALALLKRVRAEAAALPKPEAPATVVTVAVDEMWHCLEKVCQAVSLARPWRGSAAHRGLCQPR